MTLAAALALLWPALWAYALFVFFLAYITIVNAYDRKDLKRERRLGVGLAYATLGIGYVLDVGFNVFIGTLLFLELPERANITLTRRCRKWREDAGYRGAIARWVCSELNVYQQDHC
jgi:hypothetical protein